MQVMRAIHFLAPRVRVESPRRSLGLCFVISFILVGSIHAQNSDAVRCPDVAAPQSEPVKTGGNLKLLNKGEEPEYPEIARRRRIVGAVLLQVIVNEEGRVFELEPLRGHPLLILSALETVCGWEYEPVMLKGKAVPVIRTIALRFDLGREPVDPPVEKDPEGIPESVVDYLRSHHPGLRLYLPLPEIQEELSTHYSEICGANFITGDFDGDQQNDHALLLMEGGEEGRVRLVVLLRRPDG